MKARNTGWRVGWVMLANVRNSRIKNWKEGETQRRGPWSTGKARDLRDSKGLYIFSFVPSCLSSTAKESAIDNLSLPSFIVLIKGKCSSHFSTLQRLYFWRQSLSLWPSKKKGIGSGKFKLQVMISWRCVHPWDHWYSMLLQLSGTTVAYIFVLISIKLDIP